MKKGASTTAEAVDRADARLSSKAAGENLLRAVDDMHRLLQELQRRRLLQELQRHQVDLEMQNEELRRIWEGIELSPNKYAELYDFSPVGYFTFDAHGMIREVNLAGAQLLGSERRLLANKPLFSFIADAYDRDIFSNHLESALQREGMQRCEIRLTKNDGTATYWQLQSVAVETIKNKEVFVLTSFVDGTFGKHFGEELQKAHDKLESTVNERNEELTKSMQFLADLYRCFGNPHLDHQDAFPMPESNGGFDAFNGSAIGQDGNPEEYPQSTTTAGWRNFSFIPIAIVKKIGLYGLCAIAVIAAVIFVMLQPKGKTTGAKQIKTEQNMIRSFELQTPLRKMNQEKNVFAVIKFKVRPRGVIYIDGEKKGVAPILRELQVEKGKHTIEIKNKNYKVYRRVVNLAPQERILIAHIFRKSTASVAKKNVTVSKSKRIGKLKPLKTKPVPCAPCTATVATKDVIVSKSAGKEKKAVQKINPSAFSAGFTPQ
jgi:PAS domain S-box-containing protein